MRLRYDVHRCGPKLSSELTFWFAGVRFLFVVLLDQLVCPLSKPRRCAFQRKCMLVRASQDASISFVVRVWLSAAKLYVEGVYFDASIVTRKRHPQSCLGAGDEPGPSAVDATEGTR